MLVVGLLVYLMVRPPRHVRSAQGRERGEPEMEPAEAEELLRLVDRMESRLEVLERALADRRAAARHAKRRILERPDEDRETRRKK